jgi:hypothetical protein
VTLAIALPPCAASAQGPDTFSISGTFRAVDATPGIGADLAEVYAHGHTHGWTLTLYGVTYTHGFYFDAKLDIYGNPTGETDEGYITFVHAASFDFEFFGPDADVLNDVVSSQLTQGGQYFLHGEYYDPWYGTLQYKTWGMGLSPPDRNAGVLIDWEGLWSLGSFAADPSGYPIVEPQRLGVDSTIISDFRPGNHGLLSSSYEVVDVGSSIPPVLPPPSMAIADASVREGHKGTTLLNVSVILSRDASDTVTVRYATDSGSAVAPSDYTSTSGTLTFQPGQTSGTVSIAIKGDRKREKNEVFGVRLSNAVGATIADGVGVVTILNDD